MRIVSLFSFLLACTCFLSNSALAGSYCYTGQQGVIRIATAKKDKNYKPCVFSSLLSKTLRLQVTKMKINPERSVVIERRDFNTLSTKPSSYITTLIDQQSLRHNVDPDLVSAIITVESGYNINAVSSKGARGLMQLMPATANEVARGEMANVSNLFDPEVNIKLGVKYLSNLMVKYDNNLELVLAAYHAGMGNVARFGNKIPDFESTRNYVKNVMCHYNHRQFSDVKSVFCKL